FTTAAMGLDFVILEDGRVSDRGEVVLIPPSSGLSNDLLNYDHFEEYFQGVPPGPNGEVLRRHGDQVERLGGGFYRHHGRIDDMINLNGVKTSAEEIRSVIGNDLVADAKPISVDTDGSGQHRLRARFRKGPWPQGRLKYPVDRHLRDRSVVLRHMLEGTKDHPQQVGGCLRGIGPAPCGRQAKLPQVSNERHLQVERFVRLLEV